MSVTISNNLQAPGEVTKDYFDPPIIITPWVTFEQKEYQITRIEMGLHAGTHCDAPSHVKKNGKCISDYPIETWLGWAKIVNISHCKKKIIGRQDIVPYKHKFEGQDCICLLDKPLTARLDKAAIMEISSWGPKAVIFKNGANFEYIEDTLGFLECDIPMIMEVDKEKIREVQDDDFIVALPIKFEATEAAIIRLVAIRGLYRR